MSTAPPTLSPDAIDGSFVPVGRETVASVEIDGEVVLLDAASGVLRNLDPVGGIVWGCFDTTGTIDEIVSDLCEEFGADPATVRNDVLELVRALGRDGLLEGVASPHPISHEGHGHDDEPESPAGQSDAAEPQFLLEPPSS